MRVHDRAGTTVDLRDSPLNLHISHSWGGGLGRWVEDFARADHRAGNLVLESTGTRECFGIGLQVSAPARREYLASWVLSDPISEARPSHAEQRRILDQICDRLDIGHIYVSSLIGHSLDVFRLGIPVTQIHHDYFSYCPAMFLSLDGICTTCSAEDLRRCSASNPHFRPKSSPTYYLHLRDSYFEAASAAHVRHVAPSPDVPRNLRRIDPRFDGLDFQIIEHGIAYSRRDTFGGAQEGRRLRVGILGNLVRCKGLDEFRQLFETLRVIADIHLLGVQDPGAQFAERWGARYVHHYGREQLPDLLDEHRLDLALFLSTVPETFSYTLSEAWCFGVPPAAWPIGAFRSRIRNGHDGFLLPPGNEGVIDFMLDVDQDRSRLREVAARLRQKAVRSVEAEVDDFYELRASATEAARRESRSGVSPGPAVAP